MQISEQMWIDSTNTFKTTKKFSKMASHYGNDPTNTIFLPRPACPQTQKTCCETRFFDKILLIKTKNKTKIFAIKPSTIKAMNNQLQHHCLHTNSFLFHLPESLLIKTPRGSAFASSGSLGFESHTWLPGPTTPCRALPFFHLFCLPGLLILDTCECLAIPFILLE